MFSQVTRKIYGMEDSISSHSSRISSCENEIYFIKHNTSDTSPLWSKVNENEFQINELIGTICTLSANVEEATNAIRNLSARMQELEAVIGPQSDAKTAIPNQKTDLEISKQNGYIDLDDVANEKGIWELYDENWYNR